MTAVHEERPPAQIVRRLSVLPTVVGLVGVGWVLVGAWVAGLTTTGRGWTWAMVAGALVLATIVSGSVAGLYAGLGLLVIVALGVAEVEGRLELLGLCLMLVVAHETVRFSLDARRPARFDRRLLAAYLARSAAVGALVAATVLLLHPLASSEPRGPFWVPLALAMAGLPVLARTAGEYLERLAPSLGPAVRAVLAAVAALAVLTLVVLGAQARTAIESGPRDGPGSVTVSPPTTVAAPIDASAADGATAAGSARLGRWATLGLLAGTTLILAALYLAFRRPEAVFDIDDYEADDEDRTLGLAPPGQADTRQVVEVGDDDLARLLADLRFDIEAEPDPGRAVRYAYANVERRLARLRLPRARSETEREYLERALSRVGSAGGAMAELTRLFERARFDVEPVDESSRRRALASIAELEAALAPVDGAVWAGGDERGQAPPGGREGAE
jgi:hypothetical protein